MDLIAQVYPDLKQNLNSDQWLCARAILAPRNDVVSTRATLAPRNYIVNSINNDILKDVHGEMKEFLSIDTIMDAKQSTSYPTEFLNSLELSGVPSHKLQLKLNVSVMLM